MIIAPVVLRPNSLPNLAKACLAITLFLVLQAILVAILGMWPMVILSIVAAIIFGLGAMYYIVQARETSVRITGGDLTIATKAGEETIARSEIASIDLSSRRDQLTMKDGTTAFLPLEGKELLEAATLLSPSNPILD